MEKSTLDDKGKFPYIRCVYKGTANGCKPGNGELVDVLPGYHADVIRFPGMGLGGDVDRECFPRHDVPIRVCGPPERDGDAWRFGAADPAPRGSHRVRP